MSADYTNLIRVPGLSARVVVDADYNWRDLGELLAGGFDGEQADLLESLARGLKEKGVDGLMQIQYISDAMNTHHSSVAWFLRELLVRLEEKNA